MKCSFCGNENYDGAKFCTMCGTTLIKNTVDTSEMPKMEANPAEMPKADEIPKSDEMSRMEAEPVQTNMQQTESPYAPQESVYFGKTESPYAQQESTIYGQNETSSYIYQSSYPQQSTEAASGYVNQSVYTQSSPYEQNAGAQNPYIQNPYAQNSYGQPANNQVIYGQSANNRVIYGQPANNQVIYGQSPYAQNSYGQPGMTGSYTTPAGYYGGTVVSSKNNGGVAALVLGIISLTLSITWMYWVSSTAGLIVGIIGLVQAHKYKEKNGVLDGKAGVGRGLSIAGTIIGGLWTLVIIIVIIVVVVDEFS